MTITQLQYVLAVAENKNFTLAAEKCFVTQPTLSMQIQKLEDELGVVLFDRNKKPIALTDIEKEIVAQAKNIVNESNRITDIVEQKKGYIGGKFTIAIIPTVMPTLLPMFLNNFIKKYPKLNLIIVEQNTEEILNNLKNGNIDVAIAATPLEEPDLKERVLYYEPFVVYDGTANENYAKNITPEELKLDHLLLLQDGHCFKNSVLNICQATSLQSDYNFTLQSGSFETLIKLSDEGLGYTLLPYLHTLKLDNKAKENLIEFKNPKPSRAVSLVYHKNGLKLHIIDALHNTIKGIVKDAITFTDVKIISPK